MAAPGGYVPEEMDGPAASGIEEMDIPFSTEDMPEMDAPVADAPPDGAFQIFVSGQSTMTLYVKPSDTVDHLKSMLEARTKIPKSDMQLKCKGTPLKDHVTLADHNIQRGDTVDLSQTLVGGC